MAETQISSGNIQTIYDSKVIQEYVRGDMFGKLTGANEFAIIQTNNTNNKKKSIPLVGKISGAGKRGSEALVGSEQPMSNYDFVFNPQTKRQGTLISNEENDKSAFDMKEEAKPGLRNWLMELKRDQMIQALNAIEAGGTYYNYGGVEASGATGSSAASAANMDTWNTNNQDRILYGSAKSNLTAGDHTTSLGTIDTTNDKLDTEVISLLKRMAADTDPLIRPSMINGQKTFIYLTGKYGFRDLRDDPVMQQSMREALPRAKNNPLFEGGDLYWDGVVIKEVEDLDKFIDATGGGDDVFGGVWGANATGDSLKTSGAGSTRVGVGFLLGAQAIVFGRGRDAAFKMRKEDDYGLLHGVAIEAKDDIKKIFFNNKQHGMITHFHSAALDT